MTTQRRDRLGPLTLVLVVLLAGVCLGGCVSHYEFGRQTRRYFTEQRVSERGATGAPAGLDSEEAAMIHAGYRHSLAPEGVDPEQGAGAEVLLISEDGRTVREANRGRTR